MQGTWRWGWAWRYALCWHWVDAQSSDEAAEDDVLAALDLDRPAMNVESYFMYVRSVSPGRERSRSRSPRRPDHSLDSAHTYSDAEWDLWWARKAADSEPYGDASSGWACAAAVSDYSQEASPPWVDYTDEEWRDWSAQAAMDDDI